MEETRHQLAYAALMRCIRGPDFKHRRARKIIAGHEEIISLTRLRIPFGGYAMTTITGNDYRLFGIPVEEVDTPHRLTCVYHDGTEYEAEGAAEFIAHLSLDKTSERQ